MYLAENLFFPQTFINSSVLLMSLMALQLMHVDRNTFWLCLFWFDLDLA